MPEPVLADVPEESRYELRVGDELVAFANYRRRNGRLVFLHTEVDPAFEGRGLGGRLAAGALDDARRQRVRVVPLCPFMASFIERHPEYRDLVDD